jgi:hypothetical protein
MTISTRTIQRLGAAIALALAVAVLAAPSALATPCPCNEGLPVSSTSTTGASASPPVVQITQTAGFEWGDFGIGAAAALGSLLILGGLWIGVRQARRSHHPLETV